jgi:hypothetical protein
MKLEIHKRLAEVLQLIIMIKHYSKCLQYQWRLVNAIMVVPVSVRVSDFKVEAVGSTN